MPALVKPRELELAKLDKKSIKKKKLGMSYIKIQLFHFNFMVQE